MLRGRGEAWIDDPANDDPRYARSLARRRLLGASENAPEVEALSSPPGLEQVREGAGGELTLPLTALAQGRAADRRRLIGALVVCAAGAVRPPSTASLERLAARLPGGDFVATLAGARIEARDGQVRFCREAGEQRRGALRPADLPRGESVFDGRFAMFSRDERYRIVPLRGVAARLPRSERGRLKALPAAVRGALPAVVSGSGAASCPLLAPDGAVSATPLGLTRLRAALGAVTDEAGATLSHSRAGRRCGA
jgi:tRNA(Ile)-lysidine synthase